MNTIGDDTLIVMPFPFIGENTDRTAVTKALLENRADIESTFKNDEYLKLDLTHKEIIGYKSTQGLTTLGHMPIGDLPAFNYIIQNNGKYTNSKIINLGNVRLIFEHTSH